MFSMVSSLFFKRQVDSSNLSWISWHPMGRGTLAVQFQNGGVYAYSGVPLKTYRELVAAHTGGESVGSTFHKQIKLGGFSYAKLS
jgi:hypothetical protein